MTPAGSNGPQNAVYDAGLGAPKCADRRQLLRFDDAARQPRQPEPVGAQPAQHAGRLRRRHLGHLPLRRVERPHRGLDARRRQLHRGRHGRDRGDGLRLVDRQLGHRRLLLRGGRQQPVLEPDRLDRDSRRRRPDPDGPVRPPRRRHAGGAGEVPLHEHQRLLLDRHLRRSRRSGVRGRGRRAVHRRRRLRRRPLLQRRRDLQHRHRPV